MPVDLIGRGQQRLEGHLKGQCLRGGEPGGDLAGVGGDLLERAGAGRRGTITGLYTVLVEGDDFNEPVADAARSILDGHIVLTRKLAAQKHFPAIDVLDSVSRVRDQVIAPEHLNAANVLLRLEAAWRANEDLIAVGAYKAGGDKLADAAIQLRDETLNFLRQRAEDGTSYEETRVRLAAIAQRTNAMLGGRPG